MILLNLKEKEKIGISHFFRLEWTERPLNLQISAFMLKIDSESDFWDNLEFAKGVRSGLAAAIDINFCRLVFFEGYITGNQGYEKTITAANIPFKIETKINTNKGLWVIVLKEMDVENINETEYIETLFRVNFGNYIIENHSFTYLYKFKDSSIDGRFEASRPLKINNIEFSKPKEKSLRKFIDFDSLINKLTNEKLRNKIKLSFTWFNKNNNSNDIEKFMFFWIAIEILTMNENSNIKPLKKLINQAYVTTDDSFFIGKICRLRGRIFHNGFKPKLEFNFLYFCDLLYFDCINQTLGLECKQLALNHLKENPTFNLETFLDETLSEYNTNYNAHFQN